MFMITRLDGKLRSITVHPNLEIELLTRGYGVSYNLVTKPATPFQSLGFYRSNPWVLGGNEWTVTDAQFKYIVAIIEKYACYFYGTTKRDAWLFISEYADRMKEDSVWEWGSGGWGSGEWGSGEWM